MSRTPGGPSTGLSVWAQAILRDRKASIGAAILVFFLLVAVFGPLFVGDPSALVGIPLQPPSAEHWFGTTGQGQDVLAGVVVGTRQSLAVGFAVGISVVLIGAVVGVCAGYFGGRVDAIFSLIFNVFLVIPGLPLAIIIAAYLPSGPLTLAFVLILTGWAWNARVIRSQTMTIRRRDFLAAAIVSGESHPRIIAQEVMPALVSLLVSQVIGSTIYAIGAQVGLEFLGLGNVSAVTWGTNLFWAQNDSALLTQAWWTFAPTGLCVALVGFGLTLLNSGFDEITNPRLQLQRAWRTYLVGHGQSPTRSTPVLRHRESATSRHS